MATVRYRAGSWQAQVRIQGARPRSSTFRTRDDAEAWAKLVEAEQRVESRGLRPVSVLLDHYLATERHLDRSSKQRLEWWRTELGGTDLAGLSPPDIAARRDRLIAEGRSPATANRYQAAISKALSVGVELGWLGRNPARSVSRRKEGRGRVRYLSEKERSALLAACQVNNNRSLYPLALFSLYTGARQGEALGLLWRNVDMDRQLAFLIDTKNGESRAVHLAPNVVAALNGLPRNSGERVFGLAGFPRKAWHRAMREAGVTGFRFHDLRHTFASYLAMSGATLVELADALGHRTLAMVKRYSHLSDSHTASVVARMAGKFPS